ncbi:NAD-glutamate dehydrogenase [Amphritea balenae]|uniref:NAD-glutamate dehydrogenase n=1 Tax=Amphritea balenae TaxID=452629 RepID=A0A3P1STL4_9GAMM|nr:NAD-glutamate dehydrogenase [Amphritea balenae]RRD00420.1 NAD-glutamate dehydrogenase [Amphritea balenae]GGK70984.1 NAD-specific glutamate dehydrogenase [Amphritea balenae]
MHDLVGLTKSQILELLTEKLCAQVTKSLIPSMKLFAEQFFSVSAPEELQSRSQEYLYSTALSYWQLMQTYQAPAPEVRVFNPDYEQHGWHSNHTVIQIHNVDMPFLVDSVRMELNRRELAIHGINNCVFACERTKTNKLKAVKAAKSRDENSQIESLVYLEIERHSDPEALEALRQSLIQVLSNVKAVVEDFVPIKQKVLDLKEELRNRDANSAEIKETRKLMDWLLDDNFIFQGYEEVSISQSKGKVTAAALNETQLGTQRNTEVTADLSQLEQQFALADRLVMFSKDVVRSKVHRPAYRDLIIVKRFDDKGQVNGECRFYGLYTSSVFLTNPLRIPVVRQKLISILSVCGFEPGGHSHKALVQILTDMPREELILADTADLKETSFGIFNMQERRKACLFVRQDASKRFYSCLYYIPRDLYTTKLRNTVLEMLYSGLNGHDFDANSQISESVLSRTHFVIYGDPDQQQKVDLATIEARILEISRSWDDDLNVSLIEAYGEEKGSRFVNRFRSSFTSAYKENFSTGNAVYDLQHISNLQSDSDIAMSFYRSFEESSGILKFKLFSMNHPLILSEVIPLLENLGLRVLGEHPYVVTDREGKQFWISDFRVSYGHQSAIDLDQVKTILQEAFARVWEGQADSDEFNRLVIGASLNWREVAMLRAYGRYIKQLRFGFSQPFLADVLVRNVAITQKLVALFRCRFKPGKQDANLEQQIENTIIEALEAVNSLDDDKILRRFLIVIKSTLRTNFYQQNEGVDKPYFSFKIDSQSIPDIPEPKPKFEVFIYSPRVEGVHLRAGKVARGGLRWSDRMEDYRTEVLGLVKAQQVKNSVIVPMGAKGCFICKRLPEKGGREAFQAEGVECYKTYIRGLLDITDNLVGGEVVHPENVVRHDEDDPYLVVAADKGTATFSDIANSISEEYGFWLGDAFASGGSQGYDHKGMGITARGAWESVKRHFRERGVNTQQEEFTVIGVGDMAGDVFGNGMLLSETISMVAAFNHMHIFIDPNPQVAPSFVERKRMFELPRSSWTDYNSELISEGGGIFERSAKWIDITPQMKQRFDITEDRLAPNDLINALLKAPVDMLWNGGIGTYVKATQETHAEVGDKANDNLRVNGHELRCKVLGEGGNLGFTQLGRIEFALNGGSSNTDFIDNAGGVDCSDHEVNIKILLNELVSQGDMTMKQRNQLLRDMTDDVAELVLKNNYRQAQALNMAEAYAEESIDDYIRLINSLKREGKLNPALEFLPTEKELTNRREQGLGFTRPELSVLICYARIELKQALINSWLTEDAGFSKELETAFPARLLEKFPEALHNHRLRREIIATQIANDLVNRMGITFVHNLHNATGVSYAQIAAAYLVSREIYDVENLWQQIEALDHQVPAETQVAMMKDMMQLMTRSTQWLLRQHRDGLNMQYCLDTYKPSIDQMVGSVDRIRAVIPASRLEEKFQGYASTGIPEPLAAFCAATENVYWLLDVIDVANTMDEDVELVAKTYFGLGTNLNLIWIDHEIRQFNAANHWQALAKNSYRIELDIQHRALTLSVLQSGERGSSVEHRMEHWQQKNTELLERWHTTLRDIQNTKLIDCAIFSVALSVLLELS